MMKFQLAQALEILRQTPATVKSLVGDLSDEWTHSIGDQADWSPFDIVGHYIHCEETDWIPRARLILAQGENRVFEPFDRFGQFTKFENWTLSQLLDEFALRRQASLKTLMSWNLTDEQLQFKGIHPELGEVSLEQLLSTWVVHDLTHLRQISVYLARQYESNVGAWKQYLSILQ